MKRLKSRAIGAGADRVTAGRGFLKKCCMVLHFVAFCSLLSSLGCHLGTWTSEDRAGGFVGFPVGRCPLEQWSAPTINLTFADISLSFALSCEWDIPVGGIGRMYSLWHECSLWVKRGMAPASLPASMQGTMPRDGEAGDGLSRNRVEAKTCRAICLPSTF